MSTSNIDKLRAVRTLWQEILQKSQCSIVQLHYHSIIFMYRFSVSRAKAVALRSMLDKLWGIPRFLPHLFLAIDLQDLSRGNSRNNTKSLQLKLTGVTGPQVFNSRAFHEQILLFISFFSSR